MEPRSLTPLLVGFFLGSLSCSYYTGAFHSASNTLTGGGLGTGLLNEREAGDEPQCVAPAFPVGGPTSDWHSLKVRGAAVCEPKLLPT